MGTLIWIFFKCCTQETNNSAFIVCVTGVYYFSAGIL